MNKSFVESGEQWTGLAPAHNLHELGVRLPHLHQDWAHPCHICTGKCHCTGLYERIHSIPH